MATFTPLDDIDQTTIDPVLVGIDPTITTESIQAASQPLSFDGGSLTIVGNATIGDLSQLSLLPNPNLSNQIVIPQLTVGGTMMANDIILGDNGITKLISDVSGTYIYNNLSVTGIINNNDLTTKLNSKATTTELSDLSYTVSNKADQTDLITNYYNKNQINSSLQGKANANNTYSIAQVDGFLLQKANVSDLNDKVSASNVYLRTDADLTFQTKNDMSNYATTETLINGYATQLELSDKVDYTDFQQQNEINRNSAIQNSNTYTDGRITSLSTIYQTIANMANYVTSSSLTSTLSAYQTVENMINYVTTSSLTTTLSAYQTVANMANYITTSSLTTTLSSYARLASPTFTGTVSGITKNMVGLANVDNTSDASKPVSTATQTALNLKANLANPTFTGTLTVTDINATNGIQIAGNYISYTFQAKSWVSGRVSGAGAEISDTGRSTFTVARNSAGRYTITMTTAHPNGTAFTVFPSARGAFLSTYGTPSNNSVNFEIYIYTLSNLTTNADPTDFSFFTIP